jgi:hypothetical protein
VPDANLPGEVNAIFLLFFFYFFLSIFVVVVLFYHYRLKEFRRLAGLWEVLARKKWMGSHPELYCFRGYLVFFLASC